jgi:DMSO/TMAO reductase YedYZ heme-binding membrane subunit
LALLSLFPALVYPLTWFLYIIEFVLGGIALPPPKLVINPGLGSIGFPLSIWAILGWAAVILPLCLYCVGWARRSVRKPGWFQDERHLPLVVFFVWVVLHNLAYMVPSLPLGMPAAMEC